MLEGFSYIALFLVIAAFFSSVLVLLPVILRFFKIVPVKPNPVKTKTFECGMETIGRSWVQFNFRYYFYALLLIALDVMVVFLYPWAVDLSNLGVFGFFVALFFILIIVVGYLYAWRKKAFEWK